MFFKGGKYELFCDANVHKIKYKLFKQDVETGSKVYEVRLQLRANAKVRHTLSSGDREEETKVELQGGRSGRVHI